MVAKCLKNVPLLKKCILFCTFSEATNVIHMTAVVIAVLCAQLHSSSSKVRLYHAQISRPQDFVSFQIWHVMMIRILI